MTTKSPSPRAATIHDPPPPPPPPLPTTITASSSSSSCLDTGPPQPSISPTEQELTIAIRVAEAKLAGTNPGTKRIKDVVEELKPNWTVSVRRIKKLRNQELSKAAVLQAQEEQENDNNEKGEDGCRVKTEDVKFGGKNVMKKKEQEEGGNVPENEQEYRRLLSEVKENMATISTYGSTNNNNKHAPQTKEVTIWSSRNRQTTQNGNNRNWNKGGGSPERTKDSWYDLREHLRGVAPAVIPRNIEIVDVKDGPRYASIPTGPRYASTPRGNRVLYRSEYPKYPSYKNITYTPFHFTKLEQENNPSSLAKTDDNHNNPTWKGNTKQENKSSCFIEIDTDHPTPPSQINTNDAEAEIAPSNDENKETYHFDNEHTTTKAPLTFVHHHNDHKPPQALLAPSSNAASHFFKVNDISTVYYANHFPGSTPTEIYIHNYRNHRFRRRASFSEGDQRKLKHDEDWMINGGACSPREERISFDLETVVREKVEDYEDRDTKLFGEAKRGIFTGGEDDSQNGDLREETSEISFLKKSLLRIFITLSTFPSSVHLHLSNSIYVIAIHDLLTVISSYGSLILEYFDRHVMYPIFIIEESLDKATRFIIGEVEGSCREVEGVYNVDDGGSFDMETTFVDGDNLKSDFQQIISLLFISGLAIILTFIIADCFYWYTWTMMLRDLSVDARRLDSTV